MVEKEIDVLSSKLDALVRVAKNNERKGEAYRRKELKLIKLESLSSLIEEVTLKYQKDFDLDLVTLGLEESTRAAISDALELEDRTIESFKTACKFHSSIFYDSLFSFEDKSYIGKYDAKLHGELLAKGDENVKSIAILPLVRRGKIFGTLSLGSQSDIRFQEWMGTVFLEDFASILTVCLDNALLLSRVKSISVTDALTGLWNRRFFDKKANEDLEKCFGSLSFSLMLIDIDKFKLINDTYGHDVGDLVIKELAEISTEKLSELGSICRYGGEEFVCWLPKVSGFEAREIAEGFRKSVELHNFCAEGESMKLKVTVSIGLVSLNELEPNKNLKDLDTIIKIADQRLYNAKSDGRNRVVSEDSK